MPVTYYIDGYNVIHFCDRLKPLAAQNFEAARDALVERTCRFCAITGERAKIVFDGRGRQREAMPAMRNAGGLEIVYSPGHQSADTLIERMVHIAPQRRAIIVVSHDRGLRDLCRGLGALVISPDNFLTMVDQAIANTRHNLDVENQRLRRHTVEERLDEAELAHLQRLKKELKAQAPSDDKTEGENSAPDYGTPPSFKKP